MRAITVEPGNPNSARLEDVSEPAPSEGALLVETLALGVCGTDREIIGGHYGEAPPGQRRLILGHESLGRVKDAPGECGLAADDLVVGIVRRPDPVPCPACANGEWDMCRNGRYTERGIKALHGYGSELFRIDPHFAVKIDPELGHLGVLLEPASILAKAWDHVDGIAHRARTVFTNRLLVTGAGPIGLLAALFGHQHGFELHVLDRNPGGAKEDLVRELGGTFHTDPAAIETLEVDVVMECTAAAAVIGAVLGRTAPGGIVCLVGVSAPGHVLDLDVGLFNRMMVLDNDVVFGSVNANRRHYAMAIDALSRAERGWLERMITRRVPLARWQEALEHRPGDIKVVIDFTL